MAGDIQTPSAHIRQPIVCDNPCWYCDECDELYIPVKSGWDLVCPGCRSAHIIPWDYDSEDKAP